MPAKPSFIDLGSVPRTPAESITAALLNKLQHGALHDIVQVLRDGAGLLRAGPIRPIWNLDDHLSLGPE